MNGRNHPQLSGAQRPGRWLALLTLVLVLAGCGGGEVGAGSPDVGSPAPPTTGSMTPSGGTPSVTRSSDKAGPGGGRSPGSGGTALQGTGSVTTVAATVGGDPAVAVELGGPELFAPEIKNPSESFGEVAVGAASPPHRFEVRFPLDYPVTVLAVKPGDPSFHLTEDGCTGTTLPAGGAGGCIVAVTFNPVEAGEVMDGIIVRVGHTCISDTYEPCSWTPDQWEIEGADPNFTHIVLPSGQARFDWTTGLSVLLVGQGTGATKPATDPTTPPAT
jgi:hypothetical protein